MALRHLETVPGGRLLLVSDAGALRLHGPAGEERAVAPGEGVDLGALGVGEWRLAGDRLAEDARLPAGISVGERRVMPVDEGGELVLRVTDGGPRAEASRLRLDGAVLTVRGEPHGTLVALCRGSGREVRGEHMALDLAALGADEAVWELWLDTADGRMRLGRHRDGVPGKARIAALPYTAGARLAFTPEDDLVVRIGSGAPASAPAPATEARVSLRRRLLGGAATALHRLALAAVRVMPAPRRVATGTPVVRFVIANAYGLGGTIRATFTLAEQLARQGPVEILSVRRHGRRPFFAAPAGVTLAALDDRTAPASRSERLLRALPSLLIHPEDYAYSGASLLTDVRLVRALRASGGDIVITTRPAHSILAAAVAPPDTTVIAQEHMNFGAHRPRLARAVRRSLRDIDLLAVLTEGDRREYSAALAGGRVRVVQIPDPLAPLGADRADPSARVVVAAGRLTRQKGFDLLVRAFAAVVADHDDWQLRIYGGGPERRALEELIVTEGLHDHVFLMGPTRHMGEALSTGSVFALSSRFEGFGMVLVEAMSRGLAVVSFDCPRGPGEIVEAGLSGLLVASEDVAALGARLSGLAGDEELRRTLAAGGLRRAADFAPEAVGERWRELLSAYRRS